MLTELLLTTYSKLFTLSYTTHYFLYPPQDWRELLAGSEELLALSTGPVPGQRSLAEAVQLVGLPLAFERRCVRSKAVSK